MDSPLSIAPLAHAADGDTWLLPAHQEIGMMLRHASKRFAQCVWEDWRDENGWSRSQETGYRSTNCWTRWLVKLKRQQQCSVGPLSCSLSAYSAAMVWLFQGFPSCTFSEYTGDYSRHFRSCAATILNARTSSRPLRVSALARPWSASLRSPHCPGKICRNNLHQHEHTRSMRKGT